MAQIDARTLQSGNTGCVITISVGDVLAGPKCVAPRTVVEKQRTCSIPIEDMASTTRSWKKSTKMERTTCVDDVGCGVGFIL